MRREDGGLRTGPGGPVRARSPALQLLCLLFVGSAAAQEVVLRSQQFRVMGWTGETFTADTLRTAFAVYVADNPDVPALLGSYSVENGELIFEPRFPLQPGLRYRAVFQPANLTKVFEAPRVEAAPTVIEHVFPSTSVLPENQLKFYLHFSAPMSRGEAYRRVHLLDDSGNKIQLPFLELNEELWDREGKRLTILFDPGRVKRGLLPHQEAGTPIEEGKSYTLVVERDWQDASGRPLREEFRKQFRAGPPDRHGLEPKTWRLSAPKRGSIGPLALEFPKPMDHALLERLLEVTDQRGNRLAGEIRIDREETRWNFIPREPWKSGKYSIEVARILEDLAGNTIGRPFEVDVFERVQERVYRETVSIPFEIR